MASSQLLTQIKLYRLLLMDNFMTLKGYKVIYDDIDEDAKCLFSSTKVWASLIQKTRIIRN